MYSFNINGCASSQRTHPQRPTPSKPTRTFSTPCPPFSSAGTRSLGWTAMPDSPRLSQPWLVPMV
eukprot:7322953-Prorocentrum_lima.AAC.1